MATAKTGSSSKKGTSQTKKDTASDGDKGSTTTQSAAMSPEQERLRDLTNQANAISVASGKVSQEQVKGWVTLFVPKNPVYEALKSMPLAQAERYATGEERIPRDFRAGIKPEYQKLGSSFTWLKGIFRAYVAFEKAKSKAEGKAKRASRKATPKKEAPAKS